MHVRSVWVSRHTPELAYAPPCYTPPPPPGAAPDLLEVVVEVVHPLNALVQMAGGPCGSVADLLYVVLQFGDQLLQFGHVP